MRNFDVESPIGLQFAKDFISACDAITGKNRNIAGIRKVIFNNPATVVIWDDDTKTVVKCQHGDTYSKEFGLAMCISKKVFGNTGKFNDIFKRWIPEYSRLTNKTSDPDMMRFALDDFCDSRKCVDCPLNRDSFRCGKGTSFLTLNDNGDFDMTDDEIKAAYERAFENNR